MAPALERKRTSARLFWPLVRGRNHRLSAQSMNLPPLENWKTGREKEEEDTTTTEEQAHALPTNDCPSPAPDSPRLSPIDIILSSFSGWDHSLQTHQIKQANPLSW